MSSLLFFPGSGSPQWMAELITLIYLGRLEKRPWQSFLRQLRLLTNSDVAMLVLTPMIKGDSATMHWSANTRVVERMLLSERYAKATQAGDCLIDIPRRSACLPSFDPGTPASSKTAFYCQDFMHLFEVRSLICVHGKEMSCCLGRNESTLGETEKRILRLLTPHLIRG